MENSYDTQVILLKEKVLNGPGTTESALRQVIEAYSASHSGRRDTPIGEVPEVLRTYLEKVVRHAYKVTEEDVQRLSQAGYSEEAIFEITISAALGAGLGRLEQGLAALQGGE
ncbi:MAG: hypothetical protein L0Z50_32005 [Verrucomicrobiales bacterium]|nr:hypothetical protein [Verrucomicrobiales bacterium]